ncbi:MAG: HNH endonuclease [Actinomycetota bacterium]
MDDVDGRVRVAAFSFLNDLRQEHEDNIPRAELQEGFELERQRVPLLGPQGIFKPAILPELPLSITTAPLVEGHERPYDDEWTPDGPIRYRYRGTDPHHHQNVGLRKAMEQQVPLVYFYGTVPGYYAAAFPAYVVADDPGVLTFTVAVDDYLLDTSEDPFTVDPAPRRAYVTRLVRARLHQVGFRQRVIRAYQQKCAICRLRRVELLDAAHILPDTDPRSAPVVPNGLALCRLHHAAFDRNVLGIRPNYQVEIRRDVLDETDGPMLVHGLQGFQGATLLVPRMERLRPIREFLAERYERFRAAG